MTRKSKCFLNNNNKSHTIVFFGSRAPQAVNRRDKVKIIYIFLVKEHFT